MILRRSNTAPYECVILYGVIKRVHLLSLSWQTSSIGVSRSRRSCYEDTKDARKRHLAARWLYDRWHLPRPAMARCLCGTCARLHWDVTAANIKVIDASIKQRTAARLRCPCVDSGCFKSCSHNSARVLHPDPEFANVSHRLHLCCSIMDS